MHNQPIDCIAELLVPLTGFNMTKNPSFRSGDFELMRSGKPIAQEDRKAG